MTRKEEIKKALEFAKEVIEEYKKNGEKVPAFIYEKGIELAEELANMEK